MFKLSFHLSGYFSNQKIKVYGRCGILHLLKADLIQLYEFTINDLIKSRFILFPKVGTFILYNASATENANVIQASQSGTFYSPSQMKRSISKYHNLHSFQKKSNCIWEYSIPIYEQ